MVSFEVLVIVVAFANVDDIRLYALTFDAYLNEESADVY
jgi:hypothetical protein